jgi:membrane-bound lytic murein transglycosylase D
MSAMRESERPSEPGVPTLVVRLPDGRTLRYCDPFHIGRDPDCEVQVQDVHVSRRHALVFITRGQWEIRDLQSSNGLLVDGARVEAASIGRGITVVLGLDGPTLEINPETPLGRTIPEVGARSSEDSVLLADYAERYFGTGTDDEVGGRTLMIRKAFQKVQQQQKRRHQWIVSVVALAALCTGGYAYYEHLQVKRLEAAAQKIFYDMKSNDVAIAAIEQEVALSGSAQGQQQVRRYMDQRRQMESNYQKYVTSLYDRRLSEKERLILQVTRTFGECEVAAPPDYIREVTRYIEKWKSTGRFARAVKLARDRGYTKRITDEFVAQDLPPQFFYLGMQESDFEPLISGSPTRWGIAKGMWQFIPETGAKYGLTIGRLKGSSQVDLADDRLDWRKATTAAARYVKDLYATDAQASGLLVIASYNWGEHRVIDLLKKMPADPRERNFWKLLEQYRDRLPLQTYEYVFSIVSAAVIGENPRLFGFDFGNPLLQDQPSKSVP